MTTKTRNTQSATRHANRKACPQNNITPKIAVYLQEAISRLQLVGEITFPYLLPEGDPMHAYPTDSDYFNEAKLHSLAKKCPQASQSIEMAENWPRP